MRDVILSLPQQLKAGIELGRAARRDRPYRNVISCGMGGSSVAGEMLSMVKDNVIVHWDYDLPIGVGASDLVICTSWSGNTEETISSYEKSLVLGCDTLVITGGGKLAELAKTHDTPLVLIPATTQPRMDVGSMAGALFGALGLEHELPVSLEPATLETTGQELADKISARMPVIYASYPWRKLTGFWKMAYSETAKRQVMVNWFPSGAHNEVVGWQGPYQDAVSFILLRDTSEPARYAANFKALLALLPEKGYTVHTVELSGQTVLEKTFNSYILALWTSWFAAQSLHMDPNATELLDEFKQLKMK